MSAVEPEIDSFARCWDDERFFEAHEVLEGLWMRTRDERQRGLIQLAAALYHIQRGNLKGARTMVERALPRLQLSTPHAMPLPVETLLAFAQRLRAELDATNGASLIAGRPRLKSS